MKNTLKSVGVLAFTLMAFGSLTEHASAALITITFGDSIQYPASGYTESGFAFTATTNSNAIFTPNTISPFDNVFSSAYYTFDAPFTTMTFAQESGEEFDFFTADIALSLTSGGASSTDVTFTGALAGGGTVSQTFSGVTALQNIELDWAGVTSVTVSASADVGLDNLLVSAGVVPEPSSALLIGLGVFGIATRRRRDH